MSDWKILNQARVKTGVFATPEEAGFNGYFCIIINGLKVKIIASDSYGWEHVSVSIHGSDFTPSWSIMCKVKELFWEDDQWVVQFHPAKSEHVNNHPGCLHMWRPKDQNLPTPPSVLVGIKSLNPQEFDELTKSIKNAL